MRRLLNLPNLLSLARLAITPLAVWSILRANYSEALLVLTVAGITDGLDGMLARKLQQSTRFGAYLDPIADKTLLVAIYLALGVSGLVPWWLVEIVFGRDILLLAFIGAALVLTEHRDFRPSVWGKLSTFIQIVTAVLVIASRAAASSALGQWVRILIRVTAVTTVWSGLHYGWRGRRLFRTASSVHQD